MKTIDGRVSKKEKFLSTKLFASVSSSLKNPLQNKTKFSSGRNGFGGTTSGDLVEDRRPGFKEVCHAQDIRSFQCNHNTLWALS
jgi:hypothetical protein